MASQLHHTGHTLDPKIQLQDLFKDQYGSSNLPFLLTPAYLRISILPYGSQVQLLHTC